MVRRYDIQSQNQQVIIKETELGKGELGQVKSAESTWLGRTIKLDLGDQSIELNRGSLIEFLNSRSATKLNKGFLGLIGGSDDRAIREVFNKMFAGQSVVLTTNEEVKIEDLQNTVDNLAIVKEATEEKLKHLNEYKEKLKHFKDRNLKLKNINTTIGETISKNESNESQKKTAVNYHDSSIINLNELINKNNEQIEYNAKIIEELDKEVIIQENAINNYLDKIATLQTKDTSDS